MPTLFLNWEGDNTNGFRRYCKLFTGSSSVYISSAGNMFGASDIGVARRVLASSPYVRGSSQSQSYSDTSLISSLLSKYYPIPITNASGGWKYQPFNLNLPSAINLIPSNGGTPTGGLVTDVEFTISNKTNTSVDCTITDVTYDASACQLLLSDVVIGDGTAYNRTISNRPGFDWRVYYGASYKTIWDIDANTEKNGIAGIQFTPNPSMVGLAIPEGTYTTSTLNSSYGSTLKGGFFRGGPQERLEGSGNPNHYPSDLIYGPGPMGILITRAISVF